MQNFQTKAQIAYTYLRERIMSGKYRPGDRLALNEIASTLEVSEIPVREALKQLEAEGYVTSVPHVGFRVAELTGKEIQELFVVRIALETLATRLAFDRIGPRVVANLDELVARMDGCLARGEHEDYWKVNKEFHETLYGPCDNKTILALVRQMWDRSDRSRAIFTLKPERAMASNEEHRVIVGGLKAGQVDLVVEGVRKHLENALQAILASGLVNR